jgi:hypothetical protein
MDDQQHQEYPKYLYHHRRAPEGKIFQSAEETQGLERKGWVDTPAKFPKKSKVVLLYNRTKDIISKYWLPKVWKISRIRLNFFYFVTAICILLSFFFINKSTKYEYVPATIFAGFTAFFSYYTYRFSKEKFRLDLFERRFEIYEKILEFCSILVTYGNLPIGEHNKEERIRFQQAVDASIRSMGFHKSRALFGEDIYELCQKLNQSYAFFLTYSDSSVRDPQTYSNEWLKNITFVSNTIDNLPIKFEAYISFGEYKK